MEEELRLKKETQDRIHLIPVSLIENVHEQARYPPEVYYPWPCVCLYAGMAVTHGQI